jgi:hypothetical protein
MYLYINLYIRMDENTYNKKTVKFGKLITLLQSRLYITDYFTEMTNACYPKWPHIPGQYISNYYYDENRGEIVKKLIEIKPKYKTIMSLSFKI